MMLATPRCLVTTLPLAPASTRNLLAASADAGVSHYIALSVEAMLRLVEHDFFRAKMVQEKLHPGGKEVLTAILHSTQIL